MSVKAFPARVKRIEEQFPGSPTVTIALSNGFGFTERLTEARRWPVGSKVKIEVHPVQ